MSKLTEQLQLFDEGAIPSPTRNSKKAAPRRHTRVGGPTVVDEMLRLWALAKPRERKRLLATIDRAHRLQAAKPTGRVTAGAASASDKRVDAAIAATRALTPEELAVFSEWFAEYRSDVCGDGEVVIHPQGG